VSGRIIEVVPGDLQLSAKFIDCHAEDIETQHAAAHTEIESAQPGLVGMSAAAIAEKAAEWQTVTQALCAQLTDHSAAFRDSAIGYHTTDDHNAEKIGELGAEAQHSTWV
jgi:uncharacterized protein YukE